jgi:hypothetical protein
MFVITPQCGDRPSRVIDGTRNSEADARGAANDGESPAPQV